MYNALEPCPFKIKPDGKAEELSFFPDGSGAFRLDFARVGNISDPTPRKNDDRAAVLKRLASPLSNATSAEVASRAADFISTRQTDDALKLLMPLARAPRPDFRVLANLAHCYAIRRAWRDALQYHEAAILDAEIPDDLAGTTPEQRKWLQRVEKDYYSRWLKLNYEESLHPVPSNREDIFPLFGKEIPSDAIAIVQQLMLWRPEDARLYWLLAELYAKSNRPRQAQQIFKSLYFDRGYQNRPLVLEHMAAAKKAAEALPPDVEPAVEPPTPDPAKPDDRPLYERLGLDLTRLIIGAVAFGLLAATFLIFQIRKLLRKSRL